MLHIMWYNFTVLVHKLTICRDYSKTCARALQILWWSKTVEWKVWCCICRCFTEWNWSLWCHYWFLVNSGCRILVEGIVGCNIVYFFLLFFLIYTYGSYLFILNHRFKHAFYPWGSSDSEESQCSHRSFNGCRCWRDEVFTLFFQFIVYT